MHNLAVASVDPAMRPFLPTALPVGVHRVYRDMLARWMRPSPSVAAR